MDEIEKKKPLFKFSIVGYFDFVKEDKVNNIIYKDDFIENKLKESLETFLKLICAYFTSKKDLSFRIEDISFTETIDRATDFLKNVKALDGEEIHLQFGFDYLNNHVFSKVPCLIINKEGNEYPYNSVFVFDSGSFEGASSIESTLEHMEDCEAILESY